MKIYGKISDSNYEPLPSANVTIIDGDFANKFGTISNLDGNFSIENDIIEPDSLFKISYLGFEPKTYKASELENKNIVLKEAIENLNEIVITGNAPTKNIKDTKNNIIKNNKKILYVTGGVLVFAGIVLLLKRIKI